MKGPARVVFMPIKDGDVVDLGHSIFDQTIVHEIGFKPGPARSRSGYLVLLVHEGTGTRKSWNGQPMPFKIPKSARPRKLRGPRQSTGE